MLGQVKLWRRCISSSRALLQNAGFQRPGGFNTRTFGRQEEQAPAVESEFEGDAPVPTYSNRTAPSTYAAPAPSTYAAPSTYVNRRPASSVSSTQLEGTHPFPEETSQDYASLQLNGALTEVPFSKEIVEILQTPIDPNDVELKPDGNIYIPEMRYRRVLNKAFGPGGWCMIPRGPHTVNKDVLSRDYALFCHGRFISQVRGHNSISYNSPALATEGVRSNAVMRACKDLGINNELWDPLFIAQWKSHYAIRKDDQYGKAKWVKRNIEQPSHQ